MEGGLSLCNKQRNMTHTTTTQLNETPTPEQLMGALQAKGMKVTHRKSTEDEAEGVIGFSNGKGTWHWFSYRHMMSGNIIYLFVESYSQITGKSKKGTRHRMSVEDNVAKLTGYRL